MAGRRRRGDASPDPGALLVISVLLSGIALSAGWFLTGHASAPDDGLQQIDMLTLHEKVPEVAAVSGRPTMVVLAGRCDEPDRREVSLSPSYGLVVHQPSEASYARLASALALPEAGRRCQPGYALVDRAGFVRYRTYDPGWPGHADEQQILLDAL